ELELQATRAGADGSRGFTANRSPIALRMAARLLKAGLPLGDRGRYNCVGLRWACSATACTPPNAWASWRSTVNNTAWAPSSRMLLITSRASVGSLRYN